MRQFKRGQDLKLVQECLAGVEEAWQEFYMRFVGLVKNIIRRHMVVSSVDSQDLVQSAFLALTSALNSYDPNTPLPHFVCMITERVLIDELRRSRAAKRHGETQSIQHHDESEEGVVIVKSEIEPQDRQMEKAELVAQLKKAFDELDPKCQELIRLRYYKELSFSEMADILDASENTLTVQTRRCLDKLRNIYKICERKGMK